MNLPLWPHPAPGALGEGAEDAPHLTPFLLPPSDGKPNAAIVVFPGGAYARRAPHEGEPVARWLNTLGISSFVLHYRVAPYRHPHPLLDAQRAIRLVRHRAGEWGIDPDRIGVLGFSAGGHLASTLGTRFDGGRSEADDPIERHSCRPDLLILCYPVITLLEKTHVGSLHNLLGEAPDLEERRSLSNELQVSAGTPPTFLWHTADDQGVPVENSLLFASALAEHGVPFALHVYPSGRHGLGLAQDHPEVRSWVEACADWLRARGFA